MLLAEGLTQQLYAEWLRERQASASVEKARDFADYLTNFDAQDFLGLDRQSVVAAAQRIRLAPLH